MTIAPIRPDIVVSPIKQQFLDYVAQCYDEWLERYSTEPNGIVFGFGDFEGNASSHWVFPNLEVGNKCEMLLISIAHKIGRSSD